MGSKYEMSKLWKGVSMKTLTKEEIEVLNSIYEEMLQQEDKEFTDDWLYKDIRIKLKNFIDSLEKTK